jgi:HD superfamily phosphohydrolase
VTPTREASNQSPSLQPRRTANDVEMESLQQVENLLDALENRWAGYWQEMQSLLNAHTQDGHLRGGRGRRKKIRSAIYGDIDLQYPDLMLVVDMPYVQRLRQIGQMGLVHFVYPEARHSRFDHTLGVAWNTQQICTSLGKSVSSSGKKALLAAAILHDIGHGPFSHCTEMWEESLSDNRGGVWGWSEGGAGGIPAYHQFPEDSIAIDRSKPHEVNGVRLIYDHPIALALIRRGLARIGTGDQQTVFERNPSLGIRSLLNLLGIDPLTVSRMIVGDRGNGGTLVDVINGDLDADKFDYYRRDAYFTGAGQAGGDVEYIIDNVQLVTLPASMGGQSSLAWPFKAVNDIVFNLMSREYFYANTANHPVAQNANAMLATAFFESYRALQDACLNLDPENPIRDIAGRLLGYLPFMEDQDVWVFLDTMGRVKSEDYYRQDCCGVVSYIVSKLRSRSLFERSLPLTGTANNRFTRSVRKAVTGGQNTRDIHESRQLVDFVYIIDHSDQMSQHEDGESRAFRGITLIDWGWTPANQMTLQELTNRKKRLFGRETARGRPSVCIMPSKRARKPISLSEALDDSDDEIASGIAKYEHGMSFVQVLTDDIAVDTSGHRGKIPRKALCRQARTEYAAWLLSQRNDTTACPSPSPGHDPHAADVHRIGPIPARLDLVTEAIEQILAPT